MSFDAGLSRGRYELIADQAIKKQLELIKNYQALAKAQAIKPPAVSAPAVPKVPTGGTTNAKAAIDVQRLADAQAKAATSAQRLATEQQRTAIATTSAARADQQLARDTANAAAAQDRAALAAQRRAAAEAKAAKAPPSGLGTRNGLPVLPRTLDGLTGSAADLAKGFVTVQALEKGFSLVRVSAQAIDAKRALDGLAKSADTTGDVILTSLRAAAQGTIRDSQLIKSAATGITLTNGLIAKDLPKLVEIARAGARATSQDVGFVFDSLVRGIARGSALIIDNAGITLDAAGSYETYAKSVGKTTDQLTDQERQQAVLNAVLLRGQDIVKQVGLDGGGAAENIDRAVTSVQNLGEALAQKVAPFLGTAADGLANLLNTGTTTPAATAGRDQAQAGNIAAAASFEDYTKRVRAANAQVEAVLAKDPLAALFLRQKVTLEQLNPVQFAYAQSLIQTGTASDVALQKAQALGIVSDSLTQQTQGQSAAFTALVPQMAAVAASSTDNASQVLALNSAFLQGEVSADQVRIVLSALIGVQDAAAQAAFQEERETRNLERSFVGVVSASDAARAAFQAQAAALVENTTKSQAAAIEARKLADFQSSLVGLGDAVAGGLLTAGNAALSLASQYGVAIGEAQRLIAAQAQLADKPVPEGRAERDTAGDRAQGRTAGIQAAQQRKLDADTARRERTLAVGTDAQRIALLRSEAAEAARLRGKGSADAIRAQTALDQALASDEKKSKRKPKDPNAVGLGVLDQDSIQKGEDAQAQLDQVNKLLSRANLSEHQRNDLLEKRRNLEEQITDELQKQNRANVDAQLGVVEDAQKRLKERREAAGLQRALERGRLSSDQAEAARLRLSQIGLEQEKRRLDIVKDETTAQGLTPINGQPIPQFQGQAARADAGQQQAAQAIGQATAQAITQQVPIPNLATLPPVQQSQTIVNLTLNIDKSGNATVTQNDPSIVLNLLGNAVTFRNLSGGA